MRKKEENVNLFNPTEFLERGQPKTGRYGKMRLILFYSRCVPKIWSNQFDLIDWSVKGKEKFSILSDNYVYILVPASFLLSHPNFRKHLSKLALYLSRIEE